MGLGKLIAVIDAGPLIHLAEIDGLNLLTIFETLHLPEAVWLETVVKPRVSAAIRIIANGGGAIILMALQRECTIL